MCTTSLCYYLILCNASDTVENVTIHRRVSVFLVETGVRMTEFVKVSDYLKTSGRSRASVYRDIKKNKLKTTKIDGITHIILDESFNDTFYNETDETVKSQKETSFKEAEIIEETTNQYSEKQEIEVFRTSLSNLNVLVKKLESSKDELINFLYERIEKQDKDLETKEKNIENLNETVSTVSKDNSQLRQQLGVRDAEIGMRDSKIKELETVEKKLRIALDDKLQEINIKEKTIEQLSKDLSEIKIQFENLKNETKIFNSSSTLEKNWLSRL